MEWKDPVETRKRLTGMNSAENSTSACYQTGMQGERPHTRDQTGQLEFGELEKTAVAARIWCCQNPQEAEKCFLSL